MSPTRSDWSFSGWYREATCATAWDFVSDTVTTDSALQANWKEDHTARRASGITPSGEIGFHASGGSAFDPQVVVAAGGSVAWTFTGNDGGSAYFVKLEGGSNASPSATAQASKATLVDELHWTVTDNGNE